MQRAYILCLEGCILFGCVDRRCGPKLWSVNLARSLKDYMIWMLSRRDYSRVELATKSQRKFRDLPEIGSRHQFVERVSGFNLGVEKKMSPL